MTDVLEVIQKIQLMVIAIWKELLYLLLHLSFFWIKTSAFRNNNVMS
jgi:hypothetical protein